MQPLSTTSIRRAKAPRSRFFLASAYLAIAVAAVGFAKTFFLPLARGTFAAPAAFFIHGGLFFAWVLLFAVQATLIRRKRFALHRTLGWLALLLAAGMVVSTVRVGVLAMQRDLAAGDGPVAVSLLVGTCSSMAIFALLLSLAIGYRRRADVHKRLMLLATIFVLWPAWFRFRHYFPSVPFPEYVFAIAAADAPIPVAMLYDWRKLGRVHPVYLWGGTALVAEQIAETVMFDSPGWRAVARWLADALT